MQSIATNLEFEIMNYAVIIKHRLVTDNTF